MLNTTSVTCALAVNLAGFSCNVALPSTERIGIFMGGGMRSNVEARMPTKIVTVFWLRSNPPEIRLNSIPVEPMGMPAPGTEVYVRITPPPIWFVVGFTRNVTNALMPGPLPPGSNPGSGNLPPAENSYVPSAFLTKLPLRPTNCLPPIVIGASSKPPPVMSTSPLPFIEKPLICPPLLDELTPTGKPNATWSAAKPPSSKPRGLVRFSVKPATFTPKPLRLVS